jgi:hypothetical protein
MQIPKPYTDFEQQGSNFGNNLLKMEQLLELIENRKFRNALLRSKTDPTQLAIANSLKREELRGKRIDNIKKAFDHAREGINWVQANIENGNEGAYADFRNHMVNNLGLPESSFPTADTFYDSTPSNSEEGGNTMQEFNKDRFNKWASRSMATAAEITKNNFEGLKERYEQKIAYGPEGKTMSVPLKKGEKYDPEKELGAGWTFEKPQYEAGFKEGSIRDYQQGGKKITEEFTGGKWVPKAEGPAWKPKEAAEGEGMAKIGAIQQVRRSLAEKFLPLAKANLGPDEAKQLTQGLFMTDQFGGSVNSARLRDALKQHQRDAYDTISIKAEEYATKYSPAKAVDMALREFNNAANQSGTPGKGNEAATTPPAGFADSGKTSNGKKVYLSKDGKKAWVEP